MVGMLVCFWDSLFSKAVLVSGRVYLLVGPRDDVPFQNRELDVFFTKTLQQKRIKGQPSNMSVIDICLRL